MNGDKERDLSEQKALQKLRAELEAAARVLADLVRQQTAKEGA